MKKIIISILLLAFIVPIYAQLNPVNNLLFEQWYLIPNNYFELYWETPDQSSDTLVGYNIYRDNELYKFQTEEILFHTPNGINCEIDFLEFTGYIHVTAVYNYSLSESNYIDSSYCVGYLLDTKEIERPILTLYPNPTSGKLTIKNTNIEKILLISINGKLLKDFKPENQIDLSDFRKGLYLLNIMTKKENYFEKIIIE